MRKPTGLFAIPRAILLNIGIVMFVAAFIANSICLSTLATGKIALPETPEIAVTAAPSEFANIRWVTTYSRTGLVGRETVWSNSVPVCEGSAAGWACSWPEEPVLDTQTYKYMRLQTIFGVVTSSVPVGYVMYVPSGMFLTSLPFSAAQK